MWAIYLSRHTTVVIRSFILIVCIKWVNVGNWGETYQAQYIRKYSVPGYITLFIIKRMGTYKALKKHQNTPIWRYYLRIYLVYLSGWNWLRQRHILRIRTNPPKVIIPPIVSNTVYSFTILVSESIDVCCSAIRS